MEYSPLNITKLGPLFIHNRRLCGCATPIKLSLHFEEPILGPPFEQGKLSARPCPFNLHISADCIVFKNAPRWIAI